MTYSDYSAICATWFGLFSVYMFSAHQLPGYIPSLAKNIALTPLVFGRVGFFMLGIQVALVSDPYALALFEYFNIQNAGIADGNVQNLGLLITVITSIPVIALAFFLGRLRADIEKDKNYPKYFPYVGFMCAFVSAIAATSAIVLPKT